MSDLFKMIDRVFHQWHVILTWKLDESVRFMGTHQRVTKKPMYLASDHKGFGSFKKWNVSAIRGVAQNLPSGVIQ